MLPAHSPPPSEIRILIAEDHPMLRLGLKRLLESIPPYRVVGEVDNGLKVYESCLTLNPAIVLLDLGLPGMHGIDVIVKLRRRWKDLGIIVITADATERRAREALEAGANGYVLKNSPQGILLGALRKIEQGHTALDPALRATQINQQSRLGDEITLTPRERQILKLIAEGDRNREIAEQLSISIKTVETHRLHLMRKLDAHNAVELVNWASRLGIH
jgi:two-component system secretion response regulator SsrB